MNRFEELIVLRDKHKKEENELIYKILIDHLKPTETEILAARVHLFNEKRPKELDIKTYIRIIERLKMKLSVWEHQEYQKFQRNI